MELALLEPIEAIPATSVNIFDETEYIEGPESDEAKETFIVMLSVDNKIKNLYIHKSASINIIGSVYCKIYMNNEGNYQSITESFECHGNMLPEDIKIIFPIVWISCSSKNGIFTIKIKDVYFEIFNNTDTTIILQALDTYMSSLGECEIIPEDNSIIKINKIHKFYRLSANISGKNIYITMPFIFPRNCTDKITIISQFFKYKISLKNDMIQLRIDYQDV